MYRIGLLALSLGLFAGVFACGADAPDRRGSTATAAPTTAPKSFIALTEPITAMALHSPAHADASRLIVSAGQRLHSFEASGTPGAEVPSPLPASHLVDVQGDEQWVISTSRAQRFDGDAAKAARTIDLGPSASIAAVELGFDGTVFLADPQAQRVYANSDVLIEGASIGNPSALLLNGGGLIVGNASAVLSYNLKSGEVTSLASDVGPVAALALDHLGYIIVGTASGEIRQLATDGSVKLLHTLDGPLQAMAFDETARVLYAASGTEIEKFQYLALTGEDETLWARRDARPMHPFSQHGMTLSGAEYWPSHGVTNVSYPDDILWGFYPGPDQIIEGSSSPVAPPQAAIECAEHSFAALQEFFQSNPQAFHQAADAIGASKRFYLWVNDYSQAAANFPHEIRMNKFWYWERKPAVTGRVPGFWKWETTLLQDGTCLWPQAEQIEAELAAKLAPSN